MTPNVTPNVTPKLSLRNVSVRRGGIEVLRVDELDIAAGEALAVLGPTGAGKSTLLQVLALLERPVTGDIRMDGEPVRGRELSMRRRMAAVFQESLLLDRTVAANVELGLSLRGTPRRDRAERVRRWLDRFQIEHLAKRSARRLSGGEAQRVSLARAFVLEPEVLLLDEPFSALDQPTRESLGDLLAGVLDEIGVTAVFVTHDRDEAARLARRVAVIAGGQLRQVGPMPEVYAMPADETVAAYVGVETVVPAKVLETDDGLVLLQAGSSRVEAVADGFSAREALFCLRPEDIVIAVGDASVTSSARNQLRGIVRELTAVGAGVRVHADCGFPLVASITRRSMEELGLEVGSKVTASFKATAVHLIPQGP